MATEPSIVAFTTSADTAVFDATKSFSGPSVGSGGNRAVVVITHLMMAGEQETIAAGNMDYDGNNMTLLFEVSFEDSGRYHYFSVWYYLAPPTGVKTVDWILSDGGSHTGGNNIYCHVAHCIELLDVDQGSPFGTNASASGSDNDADIASFTPGAATSLIIAATQGTGNDTSPMTPPTAGGTWAEQYDDESGGGQAFNDIGAAFWTLAPGSTSAFTIDPTMSVVDGFVTGAFEVKLASSIVIVDPNDGTIDLAFDAPGATPSVTVTVDDGTLDLLFDQATGVPIATAIVDDAEIDLAFDAPTAVLPPVVVQPNDATIDLAFDQTGQSLIFNKVTPPARTSSVDTESRTSSAT